MSTQWTTARAREWYDAQPWLVGCNFTPSTAINQLEMWQAETFDADTIDRELALAASIGMNTVRTYLHDLLWDDAEGFSSRLDHFLDIAARHGIRPVLVIFDDCWNPGAQPGPQPTPRPGIHNSGWLQSPGLVTVNAGRSAWDRLETYVKELLTRFADDGRILMWDLYNEPGNNGNDEKSIPLLETVFTWARSVETSQPVTVAVWRPEDSMNEFVLASSDVISFHHYESPGNLRETITGLRAYERPLICSEWMARTRGSLVESNLPVFREEGVGCINWGLVDGKTQTKYVWEDPRPDSEPDPWFHELFHTDLSPYREDEIALFRHLTGRGSVGR